MIVQYLKDAHVGEDNPCWVPCAKGDPGAVLFMAREPGDEGGLKGRQVSDLLTLMTFLYHCARDTPHIKHGGVPIGKATHALKTLVALDDIMYQRLRKSVMHGN